MDEKHTCKYCEGLLVDCYDEGLKCGICLNYIHIKCLKRGSVPGGLNGDTFYNFTCQECSESKTEIFVRDKLSWLQVIVLVLHHLNVRSPGLARKGFFHWRFHIATFIDKNWEILFTKYVKKKKSWTGTVAGTLSHFSVYFFLSGTSVFKEQAWWTLKYPKLSPYLVSKIYNTLTIEKQKSKVGKGSFLEVDLFSEILNRYVQDKELLAPFVLNMDSETIPSNDTISDNLESGWINQLSLKKNFHQAKDKEGIKRKSILPSLESKKLAKLSTSTDMLATDDMTANYLKQGDLPVVKSFESVPLKNNGKKSEEMDKVVVLLDPYCYYNTSLNNISRMKSMHMQIKLMGGIRKEMILSPYSAIYLKPYIRRDTESKPLWLQMMAELQIRSNKNNPDFVLPNRAPLDYTYVQPEHIPAINSLCNQFFWPGIDLTETLQYPDFSCVVQYKRLIVGFAFLVPNVTYTENYLSFIFTRPGWTNVGIGTFMIYHLIQTSLGKDITLHVSMNNSALLLYQKFGFKVENIVLSFYDKYIRSDIKESKHAFFCRLER